MGKRKDRQGFVCGIAEGRRLERERVAAFLLECAEESEKQRSAAGNAKPFWLEGHIRYAGIVDACRDLSERIRNGEHEKGEDK